MTSNPLISREKHVAARSSTFLVDASFLLPFRPVSGVTGVTGVTGAKWEQGSGHCRRRHASGSDGRESLSPADATCPLEAVRGSRPAWPYPERGLSYPSWE